MPRVRLVLVLVLSALGCAGRCPEPSPTPPKEPLVPRAPALPPIVQTGALVLRTPAREVPREALGTKELHDLVTTMIAVMRAAPGVGLAAPQIGKDLRVIVLEDRKELIASLLPHEREERLREPFATRVLVNPKISPVGDEKATFFEGCLSVHGYVGLVTRSLEVEVSALDERGEPVTFRAKGWPARILQHEVDHLDGTLYIDRMQTRSFSTQADAKALYGGKRIEEVLRLVP